MHRAIASAPFDAIGRVPAVSIASELVRRAHDLVLDAVYGGVRVAGALAFRGAAVVEEAWPTRPAREESDIELLTRTALNAAFGDALHADGNALAIDMAWHDEAGVRLDDDEVRLRIIEASGRGCVFVHGLGCSERSWRRRGSETYGARVERELGFAPIYLRYNTGRAVETNAAEFAGKLERVIGSKRGTRFALVGHSMGGLVARAACAHADAASHGWLRRVGPVVCLGTPHHGAPLERFGRLTEKALRMSHVTKPLATIGEARSAGIQDLHDGAKSPLVDGVRYRFLGSTLASDEALARSAFATVLGDGLVPLSSATPRPRGAEVKTAKLDGLGHLGQLNDPRVYARLVRWLREA